MTIAFYMNCLSAHQLPLAKEVAELIGRENFVYVDAGEQSESAQQVGDLGEIEVKVLSEGSRLELENVEILYSGLRDIDLFERRAKKGLKTFYTSERWFKPIGIGVEKRCRCRVEFPGFLRLLVPSYRKMVKRFVKWANEDPRARVLAIGPHAKKDFLEMGVKEEKIVDWGYFVEPSVSRVERVERVEKTLRVLWAGRDIPLKHVGDIERAVVLANKNLTSALHLHLDSTPISFTKLTGVSPAEVRAAMREHDTFVFASNGYEGWGAVVSEALEEGMNVICSSDCGSGPTLLPRARLFKCGDVKALARLLELEYLTLTGQCTKHEARCTPLPPCSIGDWTAKKAAHRLINLI